MNKVCGCDNISIKFIKICDESIALLNLLFETALKEKKSPDIWKLPNVVPVYKKEKKTDKKIYCPISLLPIFSKLFEWVTYNSLFTHFASNKNFLHLLNLVFHQEIHALHNSCQWLMKSKPVLIKPLTDVREMFFDISKAFDKVWHIGLPY